MKLIDLLLEADVALIGDYYYDVSHGDLNELMEIGVSSMYSFYEMSGDGAGYITADVNQEVTVTGKFYPVATIQTSIGARSLACFTLTHTMLKYTQGE